MSTIQGIVENFNTKYNSFLTSTLTYNGFFETTVNLTSLNLGQFDRLRCELEAKGIDAYGSQLMAKEFLVLIKNNTFTFGEIEGLIRNMSINQQGLLFTQQYLDALNAERTTSSRLSLVGSAPIPENVARAIIF